VTQRPTEGFDGHAQIRFAFLSPWTTEAHVIEALDLATAVTAGSHPEG
jgi:hypothetical protein